MPTNNNNTSINIDSITPPFSKAIKIPGQVYLVGGWVRDHLLGLKSSEKDYVVTGITADQMLNLGFKQVGKDFPVFLHPTTHEEYALARTEKKQGVGYYGFVCDASPHVSLTDDLSRRDLTINAIAMDQNGQIIDPFGGKRDIQQKKLRHISPAFKQDPVRVLRVARFATKLAPFGFTIAQSTQQMMADIVKQGEASHLIAERIWQEFVKTLNYPNISVFFNTLNDCNALGIIAPHINASTICANQANISRAFEYCAGDKALYLGFILRDMLHIHIQTLLTKLKASKQMTEIVSNASLIYACLTGNKHSPTDYLTFFRQWDIFRNPKRAKTILALYAKVDSRHARRIEKINRAIDGIQQLDASSIIKKKNNTNKNIKEIMECAYLGVIESCL